MSSVCEHLRVVEEAVIATGAKRTFAGQAWSKQCRHWVYYEAVLDCDALRARFGLPDTIVVHENLDPRSGSERGLFCQSCEDAVMGLHPTGSPDGGIVVAE